MDHLELVVGCNPCLDRSDLSVSMVLCHLGRLVLCLVHLVQLEDQFLVLLDLLDCLDMEGLVLLEVRLVHLVRMNQFLVLYNFFAILIIRSHCLGCYIGLICHESSYDWCSFLGQFFRSWCPCSEGFNVRYTVTLTCTCEGCFLSHWSFQSWTTRCLTICVFVLDRT